MHHGMKASLTLAAQRVIARANRAGKAMVQLPSNVPHAAITLDGSPWGVRSVEVHVPPGTVDVDLSALPQGSSGLQVPTISGEARSFTPAQLQMPEHWDHTIALLDAIGLRLSEAL